MELAIAVIIALLTITLLWKSRHITNQWMDNQADDLEITIKHDKFKQAKRINKLSTKLDDYIEENGAFVQLSEIDKKLNGHAPTVVTEN